ncbi:MAG: PGPGW domain-containing protein [Granulosicoccus sp.]
MDQILSWLVQYKHLFSSFALLGVLLLVTSLVATPWLVARLPKDYLIKAGLRQKPHGLVRTVIYCVRALIGLILVVLGFVLMLTPGPGLVVLIVGISLAEFPGKQRLLVSIATQPHVLKSLNWMRTQRGRPPFDHPSTTL